MLKPGDRIPSARALTRNSAWPGHHRRGLFVAGRGRLHPAARPGRDRRDPWARAATADRKATPPPAAGVGPPSFRPDSILPFQMGLPALDAFPRKIWARLGARCARAMQPADMVHPPVHGLPALRAEIAGYLQVSRGIDCSPSQVFVTSGYRHTIELIAHALLKAGDRVWLENPGYPPTRELLGHLGISAVPVPVDHDGMVVAEGVELAPQARAAVVTPAHQSPLCVTLSLPRRLALLDWAAGTTPGSSRTTTMASTAMSAVRYRH